MRVKHEEGKWIMSDQPIISRTSRLDISKAVRLATAACADSVHVIYVDGKPKGVSFRLGLVEVRLSLGEDVMADGLSFVTSSDSDRDYRAIVRCQGGERVTTGELLCAISDLLSDDTMHQRLNTPAERILYTKTLELSMALMRTIVQD